MAAARSLRPATVQASQLLSTSAPKSDIDSAAKFIGAGAATVGVAVRSWNWLRLRFPHHRIRQEPLPEAAAVLLCHSWLCPLRGRGTFLSYDGFPPALRLLNTGCVEYWHLAPEERLLFPPAAVVQHNVAADWTFL